jgi:NhaA family Na+:H+ antiporter
VYWKMHVWLLEHQDSFSDESLRAVAAELGLDVAAFLAEIDKPETAEAVRTDTRVGARLDADKVPSLFINGRRVPRWKQEGETILPQIIAEAAGQ